MLNSVFIETRNNRKLNERLGRKFYYCGLKQPVSVKLNTMNKSSGISDTVLSNTLCKTNHFFYASS